MSLIGSLEDLGLGDILQIISLSQKSGVLSIRGEDGEGQIILRDGLVRSASLKDGPVDLRGVLVGGGFLEPDEYDACCDQARREGSTIDEAIEAKTSLSAERVDSLRRERVEAAVISMFAWQVGEFSFDVRSETPAEDLPFFLSQGINAQYLAMEGSRIEDESAHRRSEFPGDGGGDEPGAVPDDSPIPGPTELAAAEAVGLATVERVLDAPEADPPVEMAARIPDDEVDVEPAPAAPSVEASTQVPPPMPGPAPSAADALPNAPLVVIDPDLVALEWIKQTLKDVFPRIHIFQCWDLGLNPIRQYLARAVRPVVLLRPEAQGDPLSGIRNSHDFVTRLKSQQPRLPVLWLCESECSPMPRLEPADGVLTRPSSQQLRSPRAAAQLQDLAKGLREDLAGVLAREMESDTSAASTLAASSDSRLGLNDVTRALAEASTRGEILPLVIRFASEVFDRVAMFMVRGDSAIGIAQQGLASAGGPDDETLRRIEIPASGCAWFGSVLESRRSQRLGPSDGGDYKLAALLGSSAAAEAYLAPIESSGQVVALLYADNLPQGRPLGDTEALEVVLQHAGLALERAVLKRTLAEAEGAPSA